MNSILRKTILTAIAMLFCLAALAQNSFTVKLKLVDAKTMAPVSFATASLTVKGHSSASKYVMTDDKGAASLEKVRKGTYILKAELMGYVSHEQEIVIEKNMDLGEIKMAEDVEVLDAARITDMGNPIVVKKDTIEYNASSFKTSDNDMLEELLKKLPGVEVESDGSITANGETISRIMIDGKEFFLDDPQLASKNIPAKLVEKVKVVEKKSEQAEFTGIDDGEEQHVIDLTLKGGVMDSVFGNTMLGGGHDVPSPRSDMNDPRYQGAAIIGRFAEKSQISLILNANNTNNRGFNDMSEGMPGGMGRGGGGRNGITTSWMGGLNGAFDLFDDRMELSGNYMHNGSINEVLEESARITYLDDGSRLHYDQSGANRSKYLGHRFGLRMEHEFSRNTSIIFEPQFNFGKGTWDQFSDFETFTERGTVTDSTNVGYTNNVGDYDNMSASGFFLFRQRLGKPGRTISANVRYNFRNNGSDGLNQSLTSVKDAQSAEWSDEIINQRYEQISNSTSVNGRVVYTEPITSHLFLEANYNYNWSRNLSTKNTYNSGGDPMTGGLLDYLEAGETFDPRYSNKILNRSISQRAGISMSYQKEGIRAQAGISANPNDIYNETTGHDPYHSKVVNWAPEAMFEYEFNDNTHIRAFYNGRTSQPSTSQLLPVADNSNPLSISLGNPNLNPYFSHNIRGNFGYTNKETFTSIHVRFGAGMVDDAITRAQWYDPAGVQYSIPVNGPGTGNANARIMINTPIGKSDFSIMSTTNGSYNQSTSFIGKGSLDSGKYYDAENASFNYALFLQDFPDLGASDQFVNNRTETMNLTQRLRLTYRNDLVELRIGGRTRMSKSWYTMENSERPATWNNRIDGSMNWTIPGGINLIADVNYNWYEGYTTPQEDEIIVNAEVTKLLFQDKFTLALRAYDILGQSKNLSVNDSSNYHQETRNNTLGRYIVMSLTYRFGDFSGMQGGRHGRGRMGHHRR